MKSNLLEHPMPPRIAARRRKSAAITPQIDQPRAVLRARIPKYANSSRKTNRLSSDSERSIR